MDWDKAFGNFIIFILVLGVSGCLILTPMNYRLKDQLRKELIQDCMKQTDSLSCMERVLGTYNVGQNDYKGKGF